MQQNLFTEGEITTSRPTITKPNVSRSTFYQGDCLVEMDKIADKSVDMILCDLPYGVTKNKWDSVIDLNEIWKHYERMIKDNGAIVLFGQDKFSARLMLSNEKLHRYNIIWQKTSPTGFLNAKKMPLRSHEDILVFYKKLPTYNPQKTTGHERKVSSANHKRSSVKTTNYGEHGLTSYDSTERYPKSVLTFKTDKQKEAIHPTQKPVELLEWFIKSFTNEGDIVMDNCMGSGSTGVACRNTNRHFIGIEQDEKYFEIAVKRIILIVDLNETTCQHYFSKNKTGLCDNCGKNLICHWKSFG